MSKKNNEISEAQLRAVMGALGRRKTAKKTETSRANVAKASAANRKNPLDLICTCSGGDSLDSADHKTTCPRGRLLWQRARSAAKK